MDVLPWNYFIHGINGLGIIYSIECFTLRINYSIVYLLYGFFQLWISYPRIIYPRDQLLCRRLTLKFFSPSDYLLQSLFTLGNISSQVLLNSGQVTLGLFTLRILYSKAKILSLLNSNRLGTLSLAV